MAGLFAGYTVANDPKPTWTSSIIRALVAKVKPIVPCHRQAVLNHVFVPTAF
jgi:hypothetical protein